MSLRSIQVIICRNLVFFFFPISVFAFYLTFSEETANGVLGKTDPAASGLQCVCPGPVEILKVRDVGRTIKVYCEVWEGI